VVEADFLDGMEYDGLYFLSNGFYNLYQGTPGDYLTAIAAHETAHQWFYAGVGNDQAYEPWLDEALCTYQEHIFFERLYPEALDWWWDYRVNYYQPRGWVNGSIYNPDGYRAYRDAVYLNGAVFLDELRSLIGDEAFFAFLRDYVSQNWKGISTGEQFFEILSQHTDQDIAPILNKFFKQE
jgi:aminopeptidase N